MKEDEMKTIARIFTEVLKITKETKGVESKIEDKSDMSIFENEEFT